MTLIVETPAIPWRMGQDCALHFSFASALRTVLVRALADGVRFELTVSLHLRRFSRPLP